MTLATTLALTTLAVFVGLLTYDIAHLHSCQMCQRRGMVGRTR